MGKSPPSIKHCMEAVSPKFNVSSPKLNGEIFGATNFYKNVYRRYDIMLMMIIFCLLREQEDNRKWFFRQTDYK